MSERVDVLHWQIPQTGKVRLGLSGAGDFENFSALAAGSERFKRGDSGVEWNTGFARNRKAGHGI